VTAELWLSLTRLERKLIRERCEVSPELREIVADDAERTQSVRLTRSQADALREAVADQLQRAGFDEHWDVNPEGRALEGIIDKLQPPAR
jgi:hypothetical protein